MKFSMYARFALEKNDSNGNVTRYTPKCVSPGGYEFKINEMDIPFDWDAYSGDYLKDGEFEFQTGYGCFINDFELTDCYDEDYEQLGLNKNDITAEFLSKATCINDFYVDFADEDLNGHILNIKEISFIERDTSKEYWVSQDVIDKFNKTMIEMEG